MKKCDKTNSKKVISAKNWPVFSRDGITKTETGIELDAAAPAAKPPVMLPTKIGYIGLVAQM